jgi:hypothetical protein
MKTIIVSGWNVGFQKINFQHKLRHEFDLSLSIQLGAKVEAEDSTMNDVVDGLAR